MSQHTETVRNVPIGSTARAEFLMRTYTHLFGAVVAFVGIEFALFQSGAARPIARAMLGVPWLAILGAFMVVGWLARRTAHGSGSIGRQYLALSGYVVAQALIFVPLLFVADAYAPGTIASAGGLTLLGFLTLTFIVFATRKNFSFLRPLLTWVGILALVGIVAGAIFGFDLGIWFSIAMVALAGGSILYDTSNVLHHYPDDHYVGAALELFASVALLFWYILRIFMGSRD